MPKNPKRRASIILLGLVVSSALAAQAAKVVASSAWLGAIVRAAGAGEDIVLLLPFDAPPSAENALAGIALAKGPKLVVFGGNEPFAQDILDAIGGSGAALKVVADNRPINLIIETRKIAERLGTEASQAEWAKSFRDFAEGSRARIAASLCPEGFPKRRVAVHARLKPWMAWMGFDVVGIFGPGEPDPELIREIAKKQPVLVIDEFHAPAGAAFAAALRADYCVLINFPGKDGTRSLEDVYLHNEKALLGAKPLKAASGGR